MIKKMAKILLPWFILAYLPNLSTLVLNIYTGYYLGADVLASLGIGANVLNFPISIFIVLSLLGLVTSAIMQEKGNSKAGLGIHIGFTCAAMGLMMSYYTSVILFPNQLMMMLGADEYIIAIGAAYLRSVSLTIILLMTAFMLIGQLMLKKPSLKVTLIVAGVMFALIWVGILMLFLFSFLFSGGVTDLGIIQGMQIATRTILPFAFIPMRSYWRTFGPEENILPAAAAIETAEAAAE